MTETIKLYEQTTYETCLACCLFQSIGINLNQELELKCIKHSMKFSKFDFISGHLDFLIKNFNADITRIVDNKLFLDYLKKLKFNNLVKTEIQKINLKLIDKLLQNSSIILYLDSFYLFKLFHYPHFVIVFKKENKGYNIYDPWDGKEKFIEKRVLSKAIISLRNHLKFCPQIILIKNL